MKYRVVQMSDGKYRIDCKVFLFWSAYSDFLYISRDEAINTAKKYDEWYKERIASKKLKTLRVIEEIE